MNRLIRGLLLGLILSLPLSLWSASAQADASLNLPTSGFYPIWETTAYVEGHQRIRISTTGAHFGVKDVLHFGVQPINYIYRVPNAYAKVLLAEPGNFTISTQLAFFHLLEGAGSTFLSPMYQSRVINSDFNVTLIPVTLVASWAASNPSDKSGGYAPTWFRLHQSLTALHLTSDGPLKSNTTLGYTAIAEFVGSGNHSVSLHGGEVGFWNHEFAITGASYRYQNHWFEFRLGYFYRFYPAGIQRAPQVGLGIVI